MNNEQGGMFKMAVAVDVKGACSRNFSEGMSDIG
jgi:hypothetical protein